VTPPVDFAAEATAAVTAKVEKEAKQNENSQFEAAAHHEIDNIPYQHV